MKKLLLTLIALLAFSCPIFASHWMPLGTGEDGTEYSIDISRVSTHTLTPLEEGQNRAVERMGYKGINVPYKSIWLQVEYTDGTSSIQHINVYQNRTIALLGFVDYDSDGRITNSVPDRYPVPDTIYPDTVGEKLYMFAYPMNS